MKTKKWLAAALAGSLLISLQAAGCSKASSSELKVLSEKTVELGEPVTLKASDYLLEEPDSSVLKEITVQSDLKTDSKYKYNSFSDTVVTDGKDFLETGTYSLKLDYDGKTYPVKITVKDTVMPEFISPAAVVTIPVGTEDFDFSKIYRTSDKDKVTLSVEGDYDVSRVGTYPVTLVAKDASGNTNSLEITINVIGKNQTITAADQFDDELVPSDSSSSPAAEEDDSQTNVIDSSAVRPDESAQNKPSQTPDSTQPSVTEPDPVPSACPVSQAPAGTQIFYSFSDLYAAGTSWNQQSPNNYFYYLEGTDDCGSKVYFLTTGSNDTPISNQQTDSAAQQSQSTETK